MCGWSGQRESNPHEQLGKLEEDKQDQTESDKTGALGTFVDQWLTVASQNRKLRKHLAKGDLSTLLELHDFFASGRALAELGETAHLPAIVGSAQQIEDELIRRGQPLAPGSAIRGLKIRVSVTPGFLPTGES
ncbi:MAG: hypothetical protein ACK4FB_06850 [Brevundimonas sp.]|uniref:hypothetical protein n=1 Tax=Brevundimonas sp. TaxID=1871086 RepID=UPI0039197C7A